MRSRDLERQTFEEDLRHPGTVSNKEELRNPPFDLDFGLCCQSHADISARTAQFCFLCLQEREYGHYAVKIPCFRPTRPREILLRVNFENGSVQGEKVHYEKLNPMENACESDAAIYDRLKEACFRYQNRWKRWIPFYGIVDVREVNVSLT